MKIYKYIEFIKEYQVGGSLPVMHFKGVNYGDSGSKSDVGTANFGDKGDSSFDKRGTMKLLDRSLVYSEHTGDYYSDTDIKALMFKYDIWCKQNDEEPIEITNFGTKTLDYILKTINSK